MPKKYYDVLPVDEYAGDELLWRRTLNFLRSVADGGLLAINSPTFINENRNDTNSLLIVEYLRSESSRRFWENFNKICLPSCFC